jgi:hypothetical protein
MTVGIRDAERESSRRVYCVKSRTRGFVHAVAKKHAVWIYCVALWTRRCVHFCNIRDWRMNLE